jgi:hypothetical protein
MVIVEIPTLRDGKTILFVSVANYSLYGFSDTLLSQKS